MDLPPEDENTTGIFISSSSISMNITASFPGPLQGRRGALESHGRLEEGSVVPRMLAGHRKMSMEDAVPPDKGGQTGATFLKDKLAMRYQNVKKIYNL